MPYGHYTTIVIGGGHAGAEAAWAAANLLGEPSSVALVTLRAETIGVMSCNPAIGGLAKGQLVREIDALGGLMGLAADATGIHFKVLNTSKGPAVRGPRCQCDRHAYARFVRAALEPREEIDIIEGAVEDLLVEDGRVRGVRVAPRRGDPFDLAAPSVVLTTGTFMRGLMHEGDERTAGGRRGEGAASAISQALQRLGFELGRLKTGTPPRIRKGSIDWESLPIQAGDDVPMPFSDLTRSIYRGDRGVRGGMQEKYPDSTPDSLSDSALSASSAVKNPDSDSAPSAFSAVSPSFPNLPQLDCRQSQTTPEVHAHIRDNLHRAPMYSGQIESTGPRYCPSIEDKVVRFADRESHGIFLEPESHESDWVYCNGISTSLPRDVQERIVRMLPGMERAEIVQYGYAVEYDMVRPHQIFATGMTKRIAGLFLAGQINGTSGYEEAGAQGLVAGVNAVRFARGEGEWVLGREQAYMGVLMDDLVTKTPVEPYRMFTSRAEHRLLLRADNAPDRLTPIARELGLLERHPLARLRAAQFAERERQMELARREVETRRLNGETIARAALRPAFELPHLTEALADLNLDDRVLFTLLADLKYAPYLERQRTEIRRHQQAERRRIPTELFDTPLADMRTEARQALQRFRPATLGQAGRLEGLTPADLTLLAVLIERHRRDRRAAG